jgi:hypothetical protein
MAIRVIVDGQGYSSILLEIAQKCAPIFKSQAISMEGKFVLGSMTYLEVGPKSSGFNSKHTVTFTGLHPSDCTETFRRELEEALGMPVYFI